MRLSREKLFTASLAVLGAGVALWRVWDAWNAVGERLSFDAVSYIGIARHLVAGDIGGSLRGDWSPLFPWLMALGGLSGLDLALCGRIVSVLSYGASLVLVWRLSAAAWESERAGAIALLWLALVQRLASFSVHAVMADTLLVALALAYFRLLLPCLDPRARTRAWLGPGAAHAAAFLAKAVALPWLAVTSLGAAAWVHRRQPRRALAAAACALLPACAAYLGWGLALKSRYGTFMSGYQLQMTVLEDSAAARPEDKGLRLVQDYSTRFDGGMVYETIPLDAGYWRSGLSWRVAAAALATNLPAGAGQALENLSLLVAPLGLLAALLALGRRGEARSPAWPGGMLLSVAVLAGAYALLGWPTPRYLLPCAPLLIAVGAGWLARPRGLPPWSGPALVAAVALSVAWGPAPLRAAGPACPDSCRDAVAKLKKHPGPNADLVAIGRQQAGVFVAHLAGRRLSGVLPVLRPRMPTAAIVSDVARLSPGAVLVWGRARDEAFARLMSALGEAGYAAVEDIVDPATGPVGSLLLARPGYGRRASK